MITVYCCRDARGYDPRLQRANESGVGPYATAEEAEAAMLAIVPEGQPEIVECDAETAVIGWRQAAGEAGDLAMVETCDRTLAGEAEAIVAWCRCEREADSSYSL